MHKPTNDPLCQTTCYADLPTTTLSTPIDLRAAPQPVSTPLCCNLCVTSVLPRTCMHCVPPLPRTCMHRPLPHTCMHRPAPQRTSITHSLPRTALLRYRPRYALQRYSAGSRLEGRVTRYSLAEAPRYALQPHLGALGLRYDALGQF